MSVHQHALPTVLLNLRLDFVMNIYTLLLVDCFLEMNELVELTFILNFMTVFRLSHRVFG